MTPDDLEALDAAIPKTLAEWWCALNRWDWPAELGEPDPEQRPVTLSSWRPDSRRSLIMSEIKRRIGYKECLREHNRVSLPGVTFDRWWGWKESRGLV